MSPAQPRVEWEERIMTRYHTPVPVRAALLAALAIGTLVATAVPAAAASRTSGHAKAACAAMLGAYQVGPRVMPMGASRGVKAPGHAAGIATIAWPAYALRGTLTVTSLTGCGPAGSQTSGAFAIRAMPWGPPIEPPQGNRGATAIPCAETCSVYSVGITAATGEFTQDPAHAGDSMYVQVSATITSTRPGPLLGRPCSVTSGCPPRPVVRETTRVSGITGYLQIPVGGQTATLSFLPPPSVYQGAVPSALVLAGWRSGATPSPAPAP